MRILLFVTMMLLGLHVGAQQQRTLAEEIRSLQVSVDNDPLQYPVIRLGSSQHITIGFDEMSHEYHRFVYHIDHCNADWSTSTQIFESDFLAGMNDMPIEDYENSLNTTQLYTHYRLRLPNENTRMLLSGNYRVSVFEDGNTEDTLLVAEFCVLTPKMSIHATLSSNTDIDFNDSHQQLSFAISYGTERVVDPTRELSTVVRQNRRMDNQVVNLRPNIQKSGGVEFTYQRALIFPAGNEYHKFELLDVHKPGMNIDNVRWYDPWYHVSLFPETVARNYTTTEDQNGAWVMRNSDDYYDDETGSEYVLVHFFLSSPAPLPGGDVYVTGQWTQPFPDPRMKMEWDPMNKRYECVAMLKQGYYNYQFCQVDDRGRATTQYTDGNFYQTENEYTILVYHRPQGGRYDQLVSYKLISE